MFSMQYRPIYVGVDSPNLGFTYFNFLGGDQLKKHPVQQFPNVRQKNSLKAKFLMLQFWNCSYNT